ncbi:MAG TPA: DUF86 domain-containing protein [Chloroflexi bacterium]|nr:DUF86 domain-containing protein [Chloroflexota bacterium]HRA31387.1 DUF86 domain-containing protein [Thermomicrobiales bacterium]
MRRDELLLRDILQAADMISEFLDGIDRSRFLNDRLIQSAVLQQLTIIGEAASRVSQTLREDYPKVPWDDARATRNFVAHQYFSIDWWIVWDTATQNIPEIRPLIAAIIEAEVGDAPT